MFPAVGLNAATERSARDPFADMLYTQEASDRVVIDAVGTIAQARVVKRAQVSLAWLRHHPVVVAPPTVALGLGFNDFSERPFHWPLVVHVVCVVTG